jgi:hypothetical protein
MVGAVDSTHIVLMEGERWREKVVVRWSFWVFGWSCGDESRWALGASEGEGGGTLDSSHIARVHGASIAPTHHTLASSSSSQVNGYTPSVDAMRMYPR